MIVLPTQYFVSLRNFKQGFWITFLPSKTLLQTLAAIWVVALMHYNCVFPKLKICGSLNIDISYDITTNRKRINKIHPNKIHTNNIYLLHIWKPFLNFQPFFAHCIIIWSWNWVSKLWFFKIPRKFQRGTTMFVASLLWLQSPSQVVTQSPLLLATPKIETNETKNKNKNWSQVPIACIALQQIGLFSNPYH